MTSMTRNHLTYGATRVLNNAMGDLNLLNDQFDSKFYTEEADPIEEAMWDLKHEKTLTKIGALKSMIRELKEVK